MIYAVVNCVSVRTIEVIFVLVTQGEKVHTFCGVQNQKFVVVVMVDKKMKER